MRVASRSGFSDGKMKNEKKSCKKFLKYLVVTKICFIFAPLSRPKMRCEISNGSLIYWLL